MTSNINNKWAQFVQAHQDQDSNSDVNIDENNSEYDELNLDLIKGFMPSGETNEFMPD